MVRTIASAAAVPKARLAPTRTVSPTTIGQRGNSFYRHSVFSIATVVLLSGKLERTARIAQIPDLFPLSRTGEVDRRGLMALGEVVCK